MTMNLFLDDNPERLNWARSHLDLAELTTTAAGTIEILKTDVCWDIVYLDHDLGGFEMVASGPGTGMEVVEWICLNRPFILQIVVHSLNQPAAERMVLRLEGAGYRAVHVPFLELKKRFT